MVGSVEASFSGENYWSRFLGLITGGSILVGFAGWVGSSGWVDTPTYSMLLSPVVLTNVTIHNFGSTESNTSKLY